MPTLSVGFRVVWAGRLVRRVIVFMLVLNNVVGPHETTSHADDAVAADQPVVRVFVGTVVDETGAPIADALVEWGYFTAKQSEREFTFTNANGEYRLETTRAWQDFRLGVHKPGYGPRWVDSLVPTRDGIVVDFVMPPASDLVGVVVDPHGEPMPDMRVTAQVGEFGSSSSRVSDSSFPGPSRVATTNERGEFVLRDLSVYETPEVTLKRDDVSLPADDVQLTLRHGRQWLCDAEFVLEDPVRFQVDVFDMPITPQTVGAVKGTVIDAETLQPVTEFRIAGRTWYWKIEAEEFHSRDGEFTVSTPVLNGKRYWVDLVAPGYAPWSDFIVAIGADEKSQVEIRLQRSRSVECEVVDAATGDAIADVEIFSGVFLDDNDNRIAWSDLGEPFGSSDLAEKQRVVTDEEGRGSFVEGERPQTFFIQHAGYARAIIEPDERESLMTEDKVLRIELVPEARLSGRILYDPIPGATFSLRVYDYAGEKQVSQNFNMEVSANEAGEFALDRLSAGTYKVQLYLRTGYVARFFGRCEVKVNEGEEVELAIGSPAGPHTLRGRASPFTILTLSQFEPAGPLEFAAYTDADGEFEISGLPEGVFEVRLDNWQLTRSHYSDREDFVEIAGDTVRDFTSVPLLDE